MQYSHCEANEPIEIIDVSMVSASSREFARLARPIWFLRKDFSINGSIPPLAAEPKAIPNGCCSSTWRCRGAALDETKPVVQALKYARSRNYAWWSKFFAASKAAGSGYERSSCWTSTPPPRNCAKYRNCKRNDMNVMICIRSFQLLHHAYKKIKNRKIQRR